MIFLSNDPVLGEFHDRFPIDPVVSRNSNGTGVCPSFGSYLICLIFLCTRISSILFSSIIHSSSIGNARFLFRGRASRGLLMEPILVMREVSEKSRLFELAEPNVPHVLAEVNEIKC